MSFESSFIVLWFTLAFFGSVHVLIENVRKERKQVNKQR